MSWSSTISCCEKSRQWPHALQGLRALRLSRLRPGLEACNAALSACAGAWRQALALLKSMQEHGPWPDEITYNAAIRACASEDLRS